MIRREDKRGWILINQHDHAEFAEDIMKYWGDDTFARPDPYDEVLFAIREHDNGWREWDSSPKVNPENKYPMNFLEMSPADQAEIWQRCFKRHSAEHPYASALIALHFGKLNEKSLNNNTNKSTVRTSHAEIIDFVSDMLKIKISSLDLSLLPKDVRVNLRLVQIGDVISLALCHGWSSIKIKDVPLGYNGRITTLNLKSGDGNNYTIDPYPFTEPLINLRLRSRRPNQKKFSHDEELRETLKQSKYETLKFSIRRE